MTTKQVPHKIKLKIGYNFQSTTTIAQPGSLDSENGIFGSSYDRTGTRLITCEADKTIKVKPRISDRCGRKILIAQKKTLL